MKRRVGLRARTDFRVTQKNGALRSDCRGVEVSSTGMVVDRGRLVGQGDSPMLLKLELELPERHKRLEVMARPVWSYGTQQGLKFVRLSDVDRLNLAEHLDIAFRRGVGLA